MQKSKDEQEGEAQHFRTNYVEKEKERLSQLIKVNSKREKETYSKMFSPKVSISDKIEKDEFLNSAPKPILSTE